jgi:hypothetical protein
VGQERRSCPEWKLFGGEGGFPLFGNGLTPRLRSGRATKSLRTLRRYSRAQASRKARLELTITQAGFSPAMGCTSKLITGIPVGVFFLK